MERCGGETTEFVGVSHPVGHRLPHAGTGKLTAHPVCGQNSNRSVYRFVVFYGFMFLFNFVYNI